MARDIFVDTSGFYALLVRRDDEHARAARLLSEARKVKRGFVTTDYVLDETATLLLARGCGHLEASLFAAVRGSQACRIEWMDPDRFEASRKIFSRHLEQGWAFTDCVSFHVMRELGLREAFTKDEHFQHAGFRALLRPEERA